MRVVSYQEQCISDYHTGREISFPRIPSAVTVGSYDGVHAGHRKIIGRMVEIASSWHVRSVVVTFEPHPRQVVNRESGDSVRLLSLLEEKAALIESLGVEWLFVIKFDSAFAAQSSGLFIQRVLLDIIGARHVIIGYDHGFGRDRQGSVQTLRRMAGENDFDVTVVDEVRLVSEHFSSTRIRKLLLDGRIGEANVFLGAPYPVSGNVVNGAKKGREIGFPTVNIDMGSTLKLLPKFGVYIAETTIDGREYQAMMNIGIRPTFAVDAVPVVEAHILDYSGDLYGRRLTFRLLDRLRDEIRFSSLEALREQLIKDKIVVEQYRK